MLEPERVELVLKNSASDTSEVLKVPLETESGSIEFSITLGDLTEVDADAIVCPANPGLEYAGFGGVQVAIARRAGMETFQEAESKAKAYLDNSPEEVTTDGNYVGVPLGFATATTAGDLQRIKRIIHVNNMRVDKEPPCDEEVIRLCVPSVLSVAEDEGLESVTFPAMGTGVWGMGLSDSLTGTIKGIRDYFKDVNPKSNIKKVEFVIYAEPSIANANQLKDVLVNEVSPRLKTDN